MHYTTGAMSIYFDGPMLVKLAVGGLALACAASLAGVFLDGYCNQYAIWRWTLGLFMDQQRRQLSLDPHVARRQPEPLYEGRSVQFAMELGRRKASDV